MNFLHEIYKKKLLENEKNLKFWDEYLQNLNSLDFSVYSDKLSVPILVPIGNRVLFRGNLKHTNEVTIALGADYFAKCSLKQAEEIRQHRIKVAKFNHETHLKEKEYLENQINSRESFYGDSGKDIIEHCSEEEDKLWRENHREKLKEYHQNKSKKEKTSRNEIDDDELWRRLEELELQEELKNELDEISNNEHVTLSEDEGSSSFIIKADEGISLEDNKVSQQRNTVNVAKITHIIPKQTPKLNLLEQVIERQKLLENKLTELKNRERTQTKSENELLSRLDEIEQLEELEDEMDRLDDILVEDQETKSEEDESDSFDDSKKPSSRKQSVSFADEDDINTLEITFKHTEVKPSIEPYDSNKGISKPSDIYKAYSSLNSAGTKSILKKSKYAHDENEFEIQDNKQTPEYITEEISEPVTNRTIVVNDVIERNMQRTSVATNEGKPMSVFKQRKLQEKIKRVQYK